jgi:CheY-like chemotaxis protein
MSIPNSNDLPILVVDDVETARAVLCDMLREIGFTRFLEARDGREALSLLAQHPAQLIFCDNVMDGMSGIEFISTLLPPGGVASAPPVIFVSAVGEVSAVEEAIRLGAADYLVKPVSIRKLRRKIEDVLARQAGKLSLEE